MGRKPITKVQSAAAFKQRQRVWTHNAYSGQAHMARANLQNMIASDSLSDRAKVKAAMALADIMELLPLLKERIDP